MMWTETYRPTSIEGMVGNEESRIIVTKWLSKWIIGSKPLILCGPPGVGKTTLIKILADQLNFDLIEFNASDTRNNVLLEKNIHPIINNSSIFGKKILLFLDEIDGLSGRDDYGGIETLIKIIQNSSIPIIMSANTISNSKFKPLTKIAKVIEFNKVSKEALSLFLSYVLDSENKTFSEHVFNDIINKSDGDVRLLLNLAQMVGCEYETDVEKNAVMDISDALDGFFNSISPEESIQFIINSNRKYIDPRFGISQEDRRLDLINAIFSSVVTSRINSDSMIQILDVLSKVDIILGRVGRNREWHLLKYLDILLVYSLFEHYKNQGIRYNQYSVGWSILGSVFMRGQSIKKILNRLVTHFNMSTSKFGIDGYHFFISFLGLYNYDIKDIIYPLDLDEKYKEILEKEIKKVTL